MTQAAASTGVGPTFSVAVEQNFPAARRIIEDELACPILPGPYRALVRLTRPAPLRDLMVKAAERSSPGLWSGLMCRKRYIDELLTESVGDVDAVVNLGAGFDTRAYRLPALAGVRVWEVDQPANIAAKQARLRALFGAVPDHVTLVPVDFDHGRIDEALAARGCPAGARTFFVLEAVTQYLSEAGIAATFDYLSRAAPGSRLAFTYVLKDLVDGANTHGQEALYRRYVVKKKLWLWGLDPAQVPDFLAAYGWELVEHPTYSELAERYVARTGRTLETTEIERAVYARKCGKAGAGDRSTVVQAHP